MGRRDQSDSVRTAILSAASKLLRSKGYEGMTIKDISQNSTVSIGSIYHFFGSKDGVLASLVQELFYRAAVVVDKAPDSEQDPYVSLALELAVHIRIISADPKLAEIYSAAYRSWNLTQVIVSEAVKRNKLLFATQLPEWGDDQFFAATNILKGAMSALVEERVQIDRLTLQQRLQFLLRAALPLFGLSEIRTATIIEKVLLDDSNIPLPDLMIE